MIKTIKLVTIVVMSIIIMGSGCKDEQLVRELEPCELADIIKSTSNTQGTIWFNTSLNSYTIYVGIAGDYDTQDVGVVCNLPEKYKIDGLKITFRANYSIYKDSIYQLIPGQKYYNLELIRISTTDNLKN
jgi:dissimilatory sulfite reductase (desulfoviridin) alpha/beta subunit